MVVLKHCKALAHANLRLHLKCLLQSQKSIVSLYATRTDDFKCLDGKCTVQC